MLTVVELVKKLRDVKLNFLYLNFFVIKKKFFVSSI